MVRFWLFGRKNNTVIQCERLVKYNGHQIEIGGLGFGDFQLGKLRIEPKVLQAVSHALMLLDASQYYFCTKIKAISEKETRDKYYNLMIEDQLRSQQIIRALMALSFDPQSKQFQETIKEMLLSSQSRASEIEKSGLSLELESTGQVSENGLEIGQASFRDRVEELDRSYPELGKQRLQSAIYEIPTVPSEKEPATQEAVYDIAAAIFALNKEYNDVIFKGKPLIEVWEQLAPFLQELSHDPRYTELIESYHTDSLNRFLINLSTEINDFKSATQLGNLPEAKVSQKKIMVIINEVIRKLETEIYPLVKRKSEGA